MHHVAILNPKWNMLDKLYNKSKYIESRWLKIKSRPWNSVNIYDTIYFKNSLQKITLKAEVKDVMQIDLSDNSFDNIYQKYWHEIGIEQKDYEYFYKTLRDKNYCILIFLQNIRKVKPFDIDKKGFGSQSSWISIDDIELIKI